MKVSVGSLDINMCTSKLIFQTILVNFVHIFQYFSKDGPQTANIRKLYKLWMLKNFTWRYVLSKLKSFPTTGLSFGLFFHFIKKSISYPVLWQNPKAVYIKYTLKNDSVVPNDGNIYTYNF